jgi:hypothetical protein
MIFLKLEFLNFFEKWINIYDLYYHINNILKKKNHMFSFWFSKNFKTCVLNLITIFI